MNVATSVLIASLVLLTVVIGLVVRTAFREGNLKSVLLAKPARPAQEPESPPPDANGAKANGALDEFASATAGCLSVIFAMACIGGALWLLISAIRWVWNHPAF